MNKAFVKPRRQKAEPPHLVVFCHPLWLHQRPAYPRARCGQGFLAGSQRVSRRHRKKGKGFQQMLTSERPVGMHALNKFSRKGFENVFLLLTIKIMRWWQYKGKFQES